MNSTLSNWKSTDQTPCGWIGVNCTSDYEPVVWSLDLYSMNLSGNLSPSIGGLIHLKYLDLSSNEFSGPIAEEIGNLSSVEEFEAYNNDLTGILPRCIGNLQNLRIFQVGYNAIFLKKYVDVRACNFLVSLTTELEAKFLKKLGCLETDDALTQLYPSYT
ncbi:hypothetical protein CRYUN_Cryun40dG0056100 [Craigia yunnanensis]